MYSASPLQRGRKWETLHLHHVVFRSCGGSDSEDNLVPLCPTCHEMLHRDARDGAPLFSDEELKGMWALWLDLGKAVPTSHVLNFDSSLAPIQSWNSKPLDPGQRLKVLVQVDTYGLTFRWDVSGAVSYAAFKQNVVNRIVPGLATKDPHFPFASKEPDAFQLSSDAIVAWESGAGRSVAEVLENFDTPLTLTAPAFVRMRIAHFDWKQDAEDRRL
jgi:hypothetical protein